MPCYHPLQASFSIRPDGKKDLKFNSLGAVLAGEAFVRGDSLGILSDSILSLPCGQCMGCRLEKSRQWALRCMNEASLHEDNCFLTLTYSPEKLPSNGSLVKSDFQNFMKRLRQEFSDVKIRYYMCGEYGDKFARPHYHCCLFGLDFPDKLFWKTFNEQRLFTSGILEKLWSHGFCVIGNLTFDSAAYVARYCTKKVTGKLADEHYKGRLPEYASMSLKPGIGAGWYDKWKGDCFPSDYLVVNGVKCKPPRYYDKLLEKEDPILFQTIKQSRIDSAKDEDDNSYRRLLDREQCQEARFKKLLRLIEKG
jgi:hypothetical protein